MHRIAELHRKMDEPIRLLVDRKLPGKQSSIAAEQKLNYPLENLVKEQHVAHTEDYLFRLAGD